MNVNDAIFRAEEYINNKYLSELSRYELKDMMEYDMQDRYLKLFHLTRIAYDKKEDSLRKLQTVLSSIGLFCNSIALIVVGKKTNVDLYLGINSKNNIQTASDILSDAFLANFPGSKVEGRENGLADLLDKKDNDVSIVNFIPSKVLLDDSDGLSGLEKFIDTMRRHEYIGMIIANPIDNNKILNRLKGLERLYTAISPLAKITLSNGVNEGSTISEGVIDTFTDAISSGISLANGNSDSISHGVSSGFFASAHFLLGFGTQKGTSDTFSKGTNSSYSTTETNSKQRSKSTQETISKTQGVSNNETREYRNKEIMDLLNKIDKHIDRIIDGQSFGLWESSAYFIGSTKKIVSMAASSFISSLVDRESNIEDAHINIFGKENKNTEKVLEYLKYLRHPEFTVWLTEFEKLIIKATNFINSKELSLLFSMPKKSVCGANIISMAEFGRNITHSKNEDCINLGYIYHMGELEKTRVSFDLQALCSHCFITGSTGSGKSNTVYKIIQEIYENTEIPFLVIEPAKGEYRDEFRKIHDINLLTTNPRIDGMLKINPFSFPSKVHVLEHLDRLIEIFNGCWEMYAAMPAILKESFEKAYINIGWDLTNSIYIGNGNPIFPTFVDVLEQLPNLINQSAYSADTKGDYIGALVTRVNSMTNGIYGQIFCDDYEVDYSNLFDENTIIDLSRVGSSETKSLIMGILILKLTEYRMSNAVSSNLNLKHITILEEAHNILKNSKSIANSTSENSNVVAKSVEMIVNSIAEMRTYGEGIVIVDQSPTSVDIAAIKNTNTKIVMRLPEIEDCETIGHSISLSEEQINELPKLETGVAAILHNNWTEAILCKIDKATEQFKSRNEFISFDTIKQLKGKVLNKILFEYEKTESNDVREILNVIDQFEICIDKKKEITRFVLYLHESLKNEFDAVHFGKCIEKFIGCSNLFEKAETILEMANKSDGGIGNYSSNSIRKWNTFIDTGIKNYVMLDSKNLSIIKQYILHARKFGYYKIDYRELYSQIYN